MMQSLAYNLQQPIAIFSSKGPVKEDEGVQVMGITDDGVSTNRTMWNILGVSGKVDKFKNTFSNSFNDRCLVYVYV